MSDKTTIPKYVIELPDGTEVLASSALVLSGVLKYTMKESGREFWLAPGEWLSVEVVKTEEEAE